MSIFSRSKESWAATPPPCPPKSRARYSIDWTASKNRRKTSSYADILNDRQDWLDDFNEQANERTALQRKALKLKSVDKEENQTKKPLKRNTSLGLYQKHASRSVNSLSDYQGYSRSNTSSVRSFTYSPPPLSSVFSNHSSASSDIPPVPPVPKQLKPFSILNQKSDSCTPEYTGRISQDLAEIEHDIRILEIEKERHAQILTQQKEEMKRLERHTPKLATKTMKPRSKGRKRGKTLPGSLATPPPQPTQPLPPRVLNPITISNIPPSSNHLKLQQSVSTELLKPKSPKRAEAKSQETEIKADVRYPKSVYTALKYYGHYLSDYEKEEIQDYPHVYFVGPQAEKKYQPLGDDHYSIVLQDHLAYRYEIISILGRGSFGQVVQCLDHKSGQKVAVKLIRNKQRFYAQALMELNILKKLSEWDPEDRYHTVRILKHFQFRGHLCIVFERLSINLYEFIKSHHYQGFHQSIIKRLTLQILQTLNFLYDHQVIHCDLKPENILLKHPSKSTIKIIDFGSSCFVSERVYTYIQSRFYRAPEVILGLPYGTGIDMWSLGCIVAELHIGVPLFPGKNEQEQLGYMMEVLGVPETYLVERCSRKKLFFDSNGSPRTVYNSKGKKRYPNSKPLFHVLRSRDALFINFIQRCLAWDSSRRMTPKEALEHEWICK